MVKIQNYSALDGLLINCSYFSNNGYILLLRDDDDGNNNKK